MKCPICLDTIRAAYVTPCHHSFCHSCITKHLRFKTTCPSCLAPVEEAKLQPDHRLERAIKRLRRTVEPVPGPESSEEYRQFLEGLMSREQARIERANRTIAAIREDLCAYSDPAVPIALNGHCNLDDLYYGERVVGGRCFSKTFGEVSASYSLRLLNSIHIDSTPAIHGSVIASVEYNAQCNMFACSTPNKQLRLYDYEAFTQPFACFPGTQITLPAVQMAVPSKIATMAWHPRRPNVLATGDYEGGIRTYDVAHEEAATSVLNEHERRVWSIDYSRAAIGLLASGSDEGRVKLWDTAAMHCTGTVHLQANVCSVAFNPANTLLAVGTADHLVHLYDTRNIHTALVVLKDQHKKAVSYVRWLDPSSLLSASTDNTIKQCCLAPSPSPSPALPSTHPRGEYRGHQHEKNFVGMAVAEPFFAVGSEGNRVCVYHRHRCEPICETILSGEEGFGSAVSWVGEREVLVGNSNGVLNAYRLIRRNVYDEEEGGFV